MSWHWEIPGCSHWERGNSPSYRLTPQTVSLGISQVMNLPLILLSWALLSQLWPTSGVLGDTSHAQSTREGFGGNTGRDLSLCLILTWCHKFVGCLFYSHIGGDKNKFSCGENSSNYFLPRQMREKERIWKTKAKFQYWIFSKQTFSFGVGRNTHVKALHTKICLHLSLQTKPNQNSRGNRTLWAILKNRV